MFGVRHLVLSGVIGVIVGMLFERLSHTLEAKHVQKQRSGESDGPGDHGAPNG